jgi:hypothetical protein
MPQGKLRSTRQSTRSSKRQGTDSKEEAPKRQRTARTVKAALAVAAVCSSPVDGLPDDLLTLILYFADTLTLRATWFVSRRFRSLQITSDELLWRPHLNATRNPHPLWESASWLSAREVWLSNQHHDDHVTCYQLVPTICSECEECVPRVLTLTKGRTTPSCILCLEDTCMVREDDIEALFRHISPGQMNKIQHRMICPRRCIALYHDPSREGHERVYSVRDLRRASSSECVLTAAAIPAYTRKYFRVKSPTGKGELQAIIRSVRMEAQVALGKRYGLPVNRVRLPFSNEIDLFKDMARTFQDRMLVRLEHYVMHPRQVVTLALQESTTAQELRLILEPENECCSIELPSALDDLLVSKARDALTTRFVQSFNCRHYFGTFFKKDFEATFDIFIAKALETDAWYFLSSVKEAATEFVCYLVENAPPVGGSDDDNVEQTSDSLSEAQRAFVKVHVCNNSYGHTMQSVDGFVMQSVNTSFSSRAATELAQQ